MRRMIMLLALVVALLGLNQLALHAQNGTDAESYPCWYCDGSLHCQIHLAGGGLTKCVDGILYPENERFCVPMGLQCPTGQAVAPTPTGAVRSAAVVIAEPGDVAVRRGCGAVLMKGVYSATQADQMREQARHIAI